MLNISRKSINGKIDLNKFSSFQILEERKTSVWLIRLIIILILLIIASMFLPWTQNIRAKGYVTTLNPADRPQSVQSLIDGRIENWSVKEGDFVNKGDIILQISESKEDYLDPNLKALTSGQIDAKNQSASAYNEKANNLAQQLNALEESRKSKLDQNNLKIEQTAFKIQSDSMSLQAAILKSENSRKQLDRTQNLYDKGIKSLTDLEIKKLSYQEAQAKVISFENKIAALKNEIQNLIVNRITIENEFQDKISKTRADRMSALSQKYAAQGNADKLTSSLNKVNVRSENYILKAPISGTVTKIFKQGIGEFIKAGENIVSIVPDKIELAVEIFVTPMDVPLLKKGQNVRIQFDGWPAIVFSGWPDNSYGTFAGEIYAIENYISENGMYRILIQQDVESQPWPDLVRVGGGTNSIILLNEVMLYYEIWRKMNGFPPDFYTNEKSENIKLKAPFKKVK